MLGKCCLEDLGQVMLGIRGCVCMHVYIYVCIFLFCCCHALSFYVVIVTVSAVQSFGHDMRTILLFAR